MNLAVIDNYDSFTYNLVEYLHKIGQSTISVFRNDEVETNELANFDAIILSPGPGLPSEAGILMEVIETYKKDKKILGICLGHQAIVEVYGGSLKNAENVQHGITTLATRTATNRGCLHNLPRHFEIGHYHSWHVCKQDLPSCLEVSCYDENGVIMGVLHKEDRVEGLQFHPESVLTPLGLQMLENWIHNK
ncbi:anthranilate synthase component II [Balneicella halophila]|nr:aminodeoxychorismate/anthranilate synthase component II [Balneicella halophila]